MVTFLFIVYKNLGRKKCSNYSIYKGYQDTTNSKSFTVFSGDVNTRHQINWKTTRNSTSHRKKGNIKLIKIIRSRTL